MTSMADALSVVTCHCQRAVQKQFGADALVVSLGLDAFKDEPISTFAMKSDDYLELGAVLKPLGLATVLNRIMQI